MKKFCVVFIAVCALAGAGSLLAQEDSTSYIFAEYYICDQNREGFSDLLTELVLGPIYDKQVEAGNLLGWGWLSHNVGGKWRRLRVSSSNNLGTLLETRDAMIEEIQSTAGEADREFTSICGDHDDYIWASVAGSAPVAQQLRDLADATYATYYVCDVSKQERADEIVKALFAPALNQLVEEGQLASWNWYAHVIGGEFRRLMAHIGADHKTLIAAVDQYNQQADATNAAMAQEFSEICNAHVDYLWDVKLSQADQGSMEPLQN